MKTSLIVRLAAFSASAVIALALVQSIALIGHPRPAPDKQVAQNQAAEIDAEAAYLPGRFADDEQAARIEPLPQQF